MLAHLRTKTLTVQEPQDAEGVSLEIREQNRVRVTTAPEVVQATNPVGSERAELLVIVAVHLTVAPGTACGQFTLVPVRVFRVLHGDNDGSSGCVGSQYSKDWVGN
jgi:hypothetical protein